MAKKPKKSSDKKRLKKPQLNIQLEFAEMEALDRASKESNFDKKDLVHKLIRDLIDAYEANKDVLVGLPRRRFIDSKTQTGELAPNASLQSQQVLGNVSEGYNLGNG